MDWSKYPLEKLLHYAAGVIPGFAALFVLEIVASGSFARFFKVDFLGYKTKITLILLAAFVIGNTLSILLGIIVGMTLVVAGAITAAMRSRPTYQRRHAYDAVPWRDPFWRMLARKRLGDRAPNDTLLESRVAFDLHRNFQAGLPEHLRTQSLQEMDMVRNKLETDDANWAAWYQHYHELILRKENRSFDSYVRTGLTFNLETAALFLLVSTFFVRSMRHWWVILPACVWIAFLVLENMGNWTKYTNRWSTLSAQIAHLSGAETDSDGKGSTP